MIETQIQTDIQTWEFDFSSFFPSGDTLASQTVLCSPAGLVELSAKSSTSGFIRKVVIDAAAATATTIYILGCQATSSSGIRHTLYKSIYVLADETGAAAIAGTTGTNAVYSAILAQSGTSAPTATVFVNTLGGTPVWTRFGVGEYLCTLSGKFVFGKTKVICNISALQYGNESKVSAYRMNNNVVRVQVRDFADNLVDGFTTLFIDIQTYT